MIPSGAGGDTRLAENQSPLILASMDTKTATEPSSEPRPEPSQDFRPIFIVGCQRSGTTALAVMFDRHPAIAMLPETQFFNKFHTSDRRRHGASTPEALVDRALADPEICNVQLSPGEVLESFREGRDGHPELFQALLSAYAKKHGKARSAEKSCGHLFASKTILRFYPEARIICILRDGRDVVRSLMKVSWGRSLPRPLACLEWLRFARAALRLSKQLPPERFTMVRYEDLMLSPEPTLRRLCDFVGEPFEDRQLVPGADTDVVPDSELEWKGKAKTSPDASRVEAWRRNATPEAVAQMNFYMGSMLRRLGYADTTVKGASWAQRLLWRTKFLPFQRLVYPITRELYRAMRAIGISPIDMRPAEGKGVRPEP